ncbi:MAG: hypothetical protein OEW80_12335 [Gemmatimonadota bacterium]|nr:hypothetical protein [Gemmatimonadota bacterium]
MRNRSALIALVTSVTLLGACRDYNSQRHVASQDGLIPADQFARYGREQAIMMAIGREFARPYNSGPEAQAEVAIAYARNRFGKDIADISADPQGNRLVVTFKSGWRTAIVPIKDGKTGDETQIPS